MSHFFLIILIVILCILISGSIYLFFRFRDLLFFIKSRIFRSLGSILLVSILAFGVVGRTWLTALFVYLCMGYIAAEIITFIMKRTRYKTVWEKIYMHGLFVWIFALLFCLAGYLNTKHIVVREYDVALSKPLLLKIAFISDIHLGGAIKAKELDEILARVNETNPDIIFLGGDIYDEGSTEELKEYSYQIFKQMKSRYGVYYITGNHELSSHGPGVDIDKIIVRLNESGVRPLMDETVLINDTFYLTGRIDARAQRATLDALLMDANKELPVILLDHQPMHLDESRNAGIDLQLSGHTHGGQMFPVNFVVRAIFEESNGYSRWDDFHIIVSCGVGSWGFPIRTAGRPEIVIINIK